MQKDRTTVRYQPGKKIGAGSFATVYAARDTRLNRDVAVKQLHAQYLQDKNQLERYWQEAQLLGSIEHPNVMTIYDVVQKQGCLILEQMKGSLKEIYSAKPMPVEEVRQTIIQAAQGLKCLHENGIVHGDVKPGNLFLSRQDVVKLGDFGLARRVADDDGSLVKGTTRYMAPELVSDEFGNVGPASDLYSLGFSALEMLVGPEFESLFPDLIAFGRDRQMAWMMWHCSADRKLPPVQTLLAGVPEDLANVLERLTAKNQAERYKNAKDVIADLRGQATPVGKSLQDDAAEAERLAILKRKKRRRLWATCLSSLLLTALIVSWAFWPKPEVVKPTIPEPVRGVVENVLPLDQKLVLDIGTDWKEFSLKEGDKVTLNRKERQLRDLALDDRVVIHSRLTPENKIRYDIVAFRPETHTGVIAEVQPDEGKFLLRVTEGEEADSEFLLAAPPETEITLNAKSEFDGQPYSVQALAAGDQVVVRHSDDEAGMLALSVEAIREVTLMGFARKIDVSGKTITIALEESEQDSTTFVRIPLANDCIVKLNGNASLNDQLIRFADLKPGDEVSLKHDVKVRSIDAFRLFYDEGPVVAIDLENKKVILDSSDSGAEQTYSINDQIPITLGSESIQLADLRVGDKIKISHKHPESAEPNLTTLAAIRPTNSKRWAILIANQSFSDKKINPLSGPVDSARALHEKLKTRYAVPEDQAFFCEDFAGVRLRQEIPDWISRIPGDAELYVYVSTRAYSIPNENVYLAAQDSELESIDESGIQLDWLIDQLDRCATDQKILFLDCTSQDTRSDNAQRSSEEMIDVVRSTHRGGYPKSVYVLGNTRKNQTGSIDASTRQSLFATVLARGFDGEADQVGDNQIDITELADFVESSISKSSSSQQPILFLPDPSPPRISDTAKKSIIDLLSRFSQRKLDLETIADEFSIVDAQAPGQPEPSLAYGILLMKAREVDKAYELVDRVRLNHPTSLPAHRCAIWINFYKMRYNEGMDKLLAMLKQIPLPEELEQGYSDRTLEIFEWSGRLRELAGAADWTERVPSKSELAEFDREIAKYGDEAANQYAAGRKHVREILEGFAADIKADSQSPSRLKQRRIRSYMDSIASDKLIAEIKEGLDK